MLNNVPMLYTSAHPNTVRDLLPVAGWRGGLGRIPLNIFRRLISYA